MKSANAANDVALVHAAECSILLMHATASMLAGVLFLFLQIGSEHALAGSRSMEQGQ